MTKEASGIPVHCAHDELADVTNLIPNPRNPNRHGDKQVAMLAKIIRHQGWRAPIVVSKRSGFIVTGHGRLEAAKLLQVQTVPVNFQDFATEADEWAHLIADNRIAELAEIDSGELQGLLDDLQKIAPDMDIALSGFTSKELEELSVEVDKDIERGDILELLNVTIADPVVKVEVGQVWRAGSHVVACMDVFTDWEKWSVLLEPKSLFLPYAGPLILITSKAKESRFVVVNPDPYLCGHILQKWEELTKMKSTHD